MNVDRAHVLDNFQRGINLFHELSLRRNLYCLKDLIEKKMMEILELGFEVVSRRGNLHRNISIL